MYGVFYVVISFETRKRQWLHDSVNALHATELYTLKWFIVCYVHFSTIKKEKGLWGCVLVRPWVQRWAVGHICWNARTATALQTRAGILIHISALSRRGRFEPPPPLRE